MKTIKITPLGGSIKTSVNVPGSKSYSLRALLISALCGESFVIKNLLDSDDVKAMQNCLTSLKNKEMELDAQESGLTARFMVALACISPGVQIITGVAGLKKRPIKDLVIALSQLGAKIEYLDKKGFLPVKVTSSELGGDKVSLNGNVSSQYLSALLLIAPLLKDELTIEVSGKQISKPYIDMTIDVMSDFGVTVENQDYKRYYIKPQSYQTRDYTVESDYSSAAYFFAIAALNDSQITVENLRTNSKQADKEFLKILGKMGSQVEFKDSSVTVTGGNIKPVNVNMQSCPDQAMTLAVLVAFADGVSTIEGIGSLRIKETERIIALENELAKMGIRTESTQDSLTIYGGNPDPATVDTYGDHRIAMSFAVAGTKLSGIKILNPQVVNKTFPGFWDELAKITKVETEETELTNIVLIGMRGTGKSTAGKLVAKKLGKEFIDVDKFIESKHQLNIKKAVQSNGWDYFRDLESAAIKEISRRSNLLISTGGGAILRQENVENLKQNGLIFMLHAQPESLANRISTYNKLPALTTQNLVADELKQVWKDRRKKYFSSADFIIRTEGLSPKQVSDEIIAKIKP